MEAAVRRALRLAFKSDFSIAHVHVETITCRITHVVVSRGEFQGLVFEAGGMMLFESVRSVARWLQPTPTQLNPQRSEQYRGFVRCIFMAKAIEGLPHEGLSKGIQERARRVPGTCLRGRRKIAARHMRHSTAVSIGASRRRSWLSHSEKMRSLTTHLAQYLSPSVSLQQWRCHHQSALCAPAALSPHSGRVANRHMGHLAEHPIMSEVIPNIRS